MSILVSIFKEFFRHAGNMPLAMMCDKRCKDGCIVNYNGLIMLDIDKQDPEAIDDLAAKAAELEGTVFTFRSPSGNGLITRRLFPVFCLCAGKDMCVRRTMEFGGNVSADRNTR